MVITIMGRWGSKSRMNAKSSSFFSKRTSETMCICLLLVFLMRHISILSFIFKCYLLVFHLKTIFICLFWDGPSTLNWEATLTSWHITESMHLCRDRSHSLAPREGPFPWATSSFLLWSPENTRKRSKKHKWTISCFQLSLFIGEKYPSLGIRLSEPLSHTTQHHSIQLLTCAESSPPSLQNECTKTPSCSDCLLIICPWPTNALPTSPCLTWPYFPPPPTLLPELLIQTLHIHTSLRGLVPAFLHPRMWTSQVTAYLLPLSIMPQIHCHDNASLTHLDK